MKKLLKYCAYITCLIFAFSNPISSYAANPEYMTAKQLLKIMHKDNIWCYGTKPTCDWVDHFNVADNIMTQWYREENLNHNSVTIRFAPMLLIKFYICDQESTANVDYTTHYYLNGNHRWLDLENIQELKPHSDRHLNDTLAYHNNNLGCYAYVDLGFDENGFRKIEQTLFIGGIGGKADAVRDIIRIIPKAKAKVLFLSEL